MNAYVEPEMLPDFNSLNRAVEKILAEHGSGTYHIPPKYPDPVNRELFPTSQAGSAGAVAAKYLCPKKEIVLGLIGTGPRAENQLEAISREFSLSKVRVWDPDEKLAEAFCKKYCQFTIAVCNPKVTCDCDLLVTTTSSRTPIVRARWVRAGTHINAMGADEPGKVELDPTLLALGKVFVVDRELSIQAGEINVPITRGFFSADRIAGTLGEVVLGKKGRTSDDEITIFDSAGCVAGPRVSPYEQ
ncbi:MAG: hypothetical protein Q7T80_07940 [Methanoregula sp.]|nr:hypothetical protein [Methanoregula sp.]